MHVHVDHDPADVQAALDALDVHLASPDADAVEDTLAGRPVRTKVALIVSIGVIVIAWITGAQSVVPLVAITVLLVTWLVWLLDRRVRPRDELDQPHETLRSVLIAMRQGRAGYVLASLSPTARASKVTRPQQPPLSWDAISNNSRTESKMMTRSR